MKKKFLVVAAIISSSALQAQQDSSAYFLDEVSVTASKYPKKQSETGKVITIINSRQLEKSTGKTLMDVLNTVVGTTIIGANNNAGTNQTVSLRGASAGNTLILIDGIPVNDPSVITNYFDLNLLSIDQIERIEILKGGQSTLYGSDAVAGVINIISKKTGGQPFSINAGLTAGSYSSFKQNLGISGRNKVLSYTAGYTHYHSKGFSAATDRTGNGNFDKDGFNQHALNARLGIRISERLQASIFGQYNYYKTDLDATAFTDEKDYTVKNNNGQAGAGLVYTHRGGAIHFNYAFNYTERAYLDDSSYRSSPYVDFSRSLYIGRTHYAEVYNTVKCGNWELVAGIDFRLNNTDQTYFSTGQYGPYEPPVLNAKMNQLSPYASLQYKAKNGFNVEAGGRWNHHSEYGNNFTYNFNPSFSLNRKVKIFTNLYSAFKTPTLYQLFDPGAGNVNLKPEKSWVGEAGLSLSPSSSLNLRLVGFYRNTKNSIQYILVDPVNFTSQYRNISKQQNYGVEVEAAYTVGKFDITANYTYTDGKTKSPFDGTGAPLGKDTTYYNLYRIPKNAFNLSVGFQATKALYLSTQLHSVSKREEFIYGAAPETLKAYALIDFYAAYRLHSSWRVFLDLKNLTDKKYVDLLGYNTRRFNFTTGVFFNLKG